MRHHAGKRHLAGSKNAKRLRRLGQQVVIDKTDTHRVLQAMPYSHRG